MLGITRLLAGVSLAFFFSLLTPHPAASACFSTTDCPAGMICRAGNLGIPVCREIACNSNADCPPNQQPCAGGSCRFPPTGGGGGGSGGIPQSGIGQVCGPVEFGGGVIKHVRCKSGLQCTNKRCRQMRVDASHLQL